MNKNEAFEAILDHHRALIENVGIRVAALTVAVSAGRAYEVAGAELVAYLADEVLPHALAEEQTMYCAAESRSDLTATVDEMIGEHRKLASAIEQLANAPSGRESAQQAASISALFSSHVAKENEVLLPSLVADDTVDLPQILLQMHGLIEAAHREPSSTKEESAPDPEAAVLTLLLEAATHLAHAGQGERACTLVASAWAVLRVPRPDLAVRVTAALHRLVQLVTAEPVSFRSPANGRDVGADPGLDVRTLAPAQHHESIFMAYQALDAGAGFVLVNDHDPKPLRYQFEAEHPGEFTWDYLEAGPQVWRVRIGRPAVDPGLAASSR
ncbi:MAG: DUF2249 domain-containing protein [Acidimicrobiales bacterium]